MKALIEQKNIEAIKVLTKEQRVDILQVLETYIFTQQNYTALMENDCFIERVQKTFQQQGVQLGCGVRLTVQQSYLDDYLEKVIKNGKLEFLLRVLSDRLIYAQKYKPLVQQFQIKALVFLTDYTAMFANLDMVYIPCAVYTRLVYSYSIPTRFFENKGDYYVFKTEINNDPLCDKIEFLVQYIGLKMKLKWGRVNFNEVLQWIYAPGYRKMQKKMEIEKFFKTEGGIAWKDYKSVEDFNKLTLYNDNHYVFLRCESNSKFKEEVLDYFSVDMCKYQQIITGFKYRGVPELAESRWDKLKTGLIELYPVYLDWEREQYIVSVWSSKQHKFQKLTELVRPTFYMDLDFQYVQPISRRELIEERVKISDSMYCAKMETIFEVDIKQQLQRYKFTSDKLAKIEGKLIIKVVGEQEQLFEDEENKKKTNPAPSLAHEEQDIRKYFKLDKK